MADQVKPKTTLSLGLRYGYGLGEFGMNFLLTFITYYLTFFLTNIAGLSMAVAATVTTVTTVIKVFGMPIAGVLIDAIRLKGSRFRGWMIIGSVLYLVGGALLFWKLNLGPAAYAVLFCVFFFIYWLGYSVCWTAFRALMDPICGTNPMDKVGLTAAASQEGTIARVIFQPLSAMILGMFGANIAAGYFSVNVIFGIIAVLCFLAVSAIVKKFDVIANLSEEDLAKIDAAKAAKAARPKMSAADFWKTIKTRPMLIFVICAIFRCAVLTVMGTLLVYYLGYVLQNPGVANIYMPIVYAVSFVGALLVPPLAKRIGKRATFVVTTLLSAVCVAALAFTGTSSVAFIVLMSLFQFFGVFSSTLIPTCMADIGEYNAMKNGSQARGFTFSIGGMAIQIAAVIGAAIASFGLVAVGFDPAAITPEGVLGLKNLFIWGLTIISVIAAVLFLLYPLTEKKMDEYRAEFAEKGSID